MTQKIISTPIWERWAEGQTRPSGRKLGQRLFEDGYGHRGGLDDGWFVETFSIESDPSRVLIHYCGGPFSRFAQCGENANVTIGTESVKLLSRRYGLRYARGLTR